MEKINFPALMKFRPIGVIQICLLLLSLLLLLVVVVVVVVVYVQQRHNL